MPDIHHRIEIGASPDVVYRLVSTADGLRLWWAEDVESLPDGRVRLGFFGRTTIYQLRPTRLDSSRVEWSCETGNEWEATELIFELRPQRTGVVLDFRHANWRDATPYFVSCNTTWGGLMFRIRSAAEGKRPGPLFEKASLAY